jgi:hypothetical protein
MSPGGAALLAACCAATAAAQMPFPSPRLAHCTAALLTEPDAANPLCPTRERDPCALACALSGISVYNWDPFGPANITFGALTPPPAECECPAIVGGAEDDPDGSATLALLGAGWYTSDEYAGQNILDVIVAGNASAGWAAGSCRFTYLVLTGYCEADRQSATSLSSSSSTDPYDDGYDSPGCTADFVAARGAGCAVGLAPCGGDGNGVGGCGTGSLTVGQLEGTLQLTCGASGSTTACPRNGSASEWLTPHGFGYARLTGEYNAAGLLRDGTPFVLVRQPDGDELAFGWSGSSGGAVPSSASECTLLYKVRGGGGGGGGRSNSSGGEGAAVAAPPPACWSWNPVWAPPAVSPTPSHRAAVTSTSSFTPVLWGDAGSGAAASSAATADLLDVTSSAAVLAIAAVLTNLAAPRA